MTKEEKEKFDKLVGFIEFSLSQEPDVSIQVVSLAIVLKWIFTEHPDKELKFRKLVIDILNDPGRSNVG